MVALGKSVPVGANVVPTENPSDPNAPAPEPIIVSDETLAAAKAQVEGDLAWYERLYPLVVERLERLDQIPEKLAFLFWGAKCRLDQKSVNKVLLKDGARADEAIAACRGVLADEANEWSAAVLEEKCRALSEPLDMKLKNLLQPLRVAVCGNMVSPPLFESIELMDRADVLARIDAVVATVF